MEIRYLPIEKELIPLKFTATIQSTVLNFTVRYTSQGDYFSMDIADGNNSPIAFGKKLLIGVDIFENIFDERLPNVKIIPLDFSGKESRITWNNFMNSVKPYIFRMEKSR